MIYSGDLNVAHGDLDVYNYQAKHLLKQAGTTLREKNSFTSLLESGYHDALRYFYPGEGDVNLMFPPHNSKWNGRFLFIFT